MTTLNGLPRSWDSFIRGICARRKMISFIQLQEECTQEEARLITREENMRATKDQDLIVHTKKKKDKKQKNINRDPSNARCYACDEKGHFARDYPIRKKRHYAHVAKDDESTNKRIRREKDDLDEEYVLTATLTDNISHEENLLDRNNHSSICLRIVSFS